MAQYKTINSKNKEQIRLVKPEQTQINIGKPPEVYILQMEQFYFPISFSWRNNGTLKNLNS